MLLICTCHALIIHSILSTHYVVGHSGWDCVLGQTLSLILLRSINKWDMATNVMPLYSLHDVWWYEPDFTMLPWLSHNLVYSNMIVIPELVCTVWSSRIKKHGQICQPSIANRHMVLGTLDGMSPHWWQYLRYWWNGVDIWSITTMFHWFCLYQNWLDGFRGTLLCSCNILQYCHIIKSEL